MPCRCPEAGANLEASDAQLRLPPCDEMLSMSQLEVANICASAADELPPVVSDAGFQRVDDAGFELRSAEWDEVVYRVSPARRLGAGCILVLHITSRSIAGPLTR